MTHQTERWEKYWKVQGQPWRTEPEIDKNRQEELTQRRAINQPNLGEIGKLSDEAARVALLLPDWLVFGTLTVPEEPTAQDFSYRQDIRIWKKSNLQMILHAHERRYIDMLLWTPPWHWSSEVELAWLSMYKAYHRDVFKQ